MSRALAPLTLAVHTVGRDSREELIADVRQGLAASPRHLPPRWFYDERGSRLFDAITELPEYYQTRTEATILEAHASEIVELARPEAIVELGAGSCLKSQILIDAARRQGSLATFVPFDISESALRSAGSELLERFPGLTVYGMVGDFANHLELIPRHGRQLVVFLGSTLGNFDPDEARVFLDRVRSLLRPEDTFLLGLDLVKPRAELIAAYDDSQGITAQFNLNLLRVLNRELGANFDPDAFHHEVRWNGERQRIEMHLRSDADQDVTIPAAGMRLRLSAGETIHTEISAKFSVDAAEALLERSSMAVRHWFTDAAGRYAVALAAPV